jgi:hypothetical protein
MSDDRAPLSPLTPPDATLATPPDMVPGDPLQTPPPAEQATAAMSPLTAPVPEVVSTPNGPQPQLATPAQAPPAFAPRVTPEQRASERADLEMRRERLAAELAQLQWDLGGLTYEMAVRDHFRLDVLIRQAGRLQEVDAELAETERLLRLRDAGAAGTCPTCASMYARGAAFCWKCGTQLLQPVVPTPHPPGT